MRFQAVIFDCDGTLVDSERLAHEALVEGAERLAVALTLEEAMARFKGGRMADYVAYVEERLGASVPATFVPEIRAHMAQIFAERLIPIKGALDLVHSLSVPFCVASSGPRAKIELSLSLTGLLPYFEGRIFSAYDVGCFKPDPGLFLHAARALGADPRCCAVVEDSLPGMQAGLAAGMTVFALADDAERQSLPQGVRAVSQLSELIALLAQ
ncbi:MAG: HAD family hydrolase [Steroidobacteraceae bacterium]